jgi:hypothetical protein
MQSKEEEKEKYTSKKNDLQHVKTTLQHKEKRPKEKQHRQHCTGATKCQNMKS